MTLTINVREHRRGNKNNGHSEKKPGNVGYTVVEEALVPGENHQPWARNW
jgi:hypothetical protein